MHIWLVLLKVSTSFAKVYKMFVFLFGLFTDLVMARSVSKLPTEFRFLLHAALAWVVAHAQWWLLQITGMVWWNRTRGRPVQISQILLARAITPITMSTDFVTLHRGFTELDYLRRDEVSLYTMDGKFFYFVEGPNGVDIYSSDVDPFLFQAQYQNAVRVLRVPQKSFLEFADSLPDEGKVVLLSNTGRCGSTLLGQMFESTGKIRNLSEPDVLVQLCNWPHLNTEEMLRAIIKVQTKPSKPQPLAYVIKPKSQVIAMVPKIWRSCPEIIHFFMYRNGTKTVESFVRVFGNAIFEDFIKAFRDWPIFKMSVIGELDPTLVKCFHSICTWMVASSQRFYLDYLDQGIPMHGIRYEDLLENPENIFSQILSVCDLPSNLSKPAIEATQRDSQRGLEQFSRAGTEKFRDSSSFESVSEDVRRRCDALCDLLKVPRLDSMTRLPQTIQWITMFYTPPIYAIGNGRPLHF